MQRYEIETYETEAGEIPFEVWLDGIKNKDVQTQVVARLQRARFGNFGDWKAIAGAAGICEMRIHSGQGFRIFYSVVGRTVILLLAGSTKKEQDRTIAKAKAYLEDYNRRVKQ
jgi:putative addiction module killer protein